MALMRYQAKLLREKDQEIERWKNLCERLQAQADEMRSGRGSPLAWLPMDAAPKDGTMLRLLVAFDDHAIEDEVGPSPTIGCNQLENTGADEWLFVGWDWQQDRYTDGKGTPVGWLPMLAASPTTSGDGQHE